MNHTDSLFGIHNDTSQVNCGTAGLLHIDVRCSDIHPHLKKGIIYKPKKGKKAEIIFMNSICLNKTRIQDMLILTLSLHM